MSSRYLSTLSSGAQRAVVIGVVAVCLNTLYKEGFRGLSRDVVQFLRRLPGINALLSRVLDSEVKGALSLLGGDKQAAGGTGSGAVEAVTPLVPIPEKGLSAARVTAILERLRANETTAEEGRAFAYTYTTQGEMALLAKALNSAYAAYTPSSGSGQAEHETLLHKAWELFMHTNALNPMLYPSLRRLETEVVSMTAWMCHGDSNTVGSLTSGGTESILMAIKTYRDLAKVKRPYIQTPKMLCPITIHPAFEKASHYFGVEIVHIPTTADGRVDVDAVRQAITADTILLVGSAPQYCHGVVDPIEQLSALAVQHGVPLHVDACFGGFMLPWLERLGVPIPTWDFRVPGVTSISADVHKYGYSSKGASVILYKTEALRMYQYYAYAEWPGGLFGSPSLLGSRPGGMIAAAWAAMVSVGQDGYLAIARDVWATTQKNCARCQHHSRAADIFAAQHDWFSDCSEQRCAGGQHPRRGR